MGNVLAFGIIGIQGVYDMKYMRVPRKIMIGGVIISLLYLFNQVCFQGVDAGIVIHCWFPGIFFLAMSFLSHHQVGYADGIAVWITGSLIGENQTWESLIVALALGGCYSLFGVCRKKIGWNSKYPFLPFLTIAIGVVCLWEKYFMLREGL